MSTSTSHHSTTPSIRPDVDAPMFHVLSQVGASPSSASSRKSNSCDNASSSLSVFASHALACVCLPGAHQATPRRAVDPDPTSPCARAASSHDTNRAYTRARLGKNLPRAVRRQQPARRRRHTPNHPSPMSSESNSSLTTTSNPPSRPLISSLRSHDTSNDGIPKRRVRLRRPSRHRERRARTPPRPSTSRPRPRRSGSQHPRPAPDVQDDVPGRHLARDRAREHVVSRVVAKLMSNHELDVHRRDATARAPSSISSSLDASPSTRATAHRPSDVMTKVIARVDGDE